MRLFDDFCIRDRVSLVFFLHIIKNIRKVKWWVVGGRHTEDGYINWNWNDKEEEFVREGYNAP